MTSGRHSHFRAQVILAYGSALAIGLQIGLILCFVYGSWEPLLTIPVVSLVFSTGVLALWNWVFPRFHDLTRSRQILAQILVTTVVMGAISFLTSELLGQLRSRPTLLEPYAGGDVTVTIPAATLATAPWVNLMAPIVPCILLTLLGFNQTWRRIFQLERSEHEARELAASAQLDALRARINPHFLFNSLNSISQLISTDPDRAEECVERLAEIFRYLLKSDARELVSLDEELEIADAYLDIERARFGERLGVEFELDDGVLSWAVPVLILQPLVENAVKHGVARKVEGGRVRISARIEGSALRLEVEDTGVGMDVPPETALERGVGLRNVHDRLVQRFGPGFAPEIRSEAGRGTRVVLRLPRDDGPRGIVGRTPGARRPASARTDATARSTAGTARADVQSPVRPAVARASS